MMDFLNQMQWDAVIPGNHDFDVSTESYRCLTRSYAGTVLAANLKDSRGQAVWPGWKLFRKNGMRIAVIGCTAPYLDQWLTPAQLNGWQASLLIPALDSLMGDVMASRPDLIILAVHLGKFTPSRLHESLDVGKNERSLYSIASRFPQIDLILGAHSHIEEAGCRFYPSVWFVQAPAHAEGLACVSVSRMPDGEMQIRSELKDISNEPEDPETETLFASWKENGVNSDRLELARLEERVRLARLLTAAVLEAVPDTAQVLFPQPDRVYGRGSVTERTVFEWFPYDNTICILELSREEFERLIQEQKALNKSSYQLFAGGEPLSFEMFRPGKNGRMKFAVSSYAAAGGGGRYPVLRECRQNPACGFQETGISVREALCRFLKKHSSCGPDFWKSL